MDEAAFAGLTALLNDIDGDYADHETFPRLRKMLGPAR